MRTPKWLVIVPLFVVVWLMPMLVLGWPGPVAHATEGLRPSGTTRAVALEDNKDNDEDSGNEDDGGDQQDDNSDEGSGNSNSNSNSNDNNSNDNHDEGSSDVTIVPVSVPNIVPVPVAAPAPPAPVASPVDEVSQCLANGGTLVYHGPNAGIAVKSFQDNLNVTLTRVSPSSQPVPPGSIVGGYMFRMSASPCGGAPYSVLPREVNLTLSYSDGLAAGRDESRFALMYYDGTTWTTAPKLFRDPASNTVSASVTGLGVYALVQQ